MADPTHDASTDAQLRQLAHSSLASQADAVDTDADLAALHACLAGLATPQPAPRRPFPTQWLAAAAAVVLVIGGIVAIAWTRRSDSAPPAVAPPPPSVESSPTTGPTSAVADPPTASPGDTITIVPAGQIRRACGDVVRASASADGAASGYIVDGRWVPADGDSSLATLPCEPEASDAPITVIIPAATPAGEYVLCLTYPEEPAGCANITVVPAEHATADPDVVRAGESVTITPTGQIRRTCLDIVTIVDASGTPVGLLVDGAYQPAADGAVTYPDCEPSPLSAQSVTLIVPTAIRSGNYSMCLTTPDVPAGCALVTVAPIEVVDTTTPADPCWSEPVPPPSLVDGSPPGDVVRSAATATWGGNSRNAVRQVLQEPHFDELPSDRDQVVAGGLFTAIVVPVGDAAIGQVNIYVVGLRSECARWYNIGPGVDLPAAMELAGRWVDALDAGERDPASLPDGLTWFTSIWADDGTRAIRPFGPGLVAGPPLPNAEVAALIEEHWIRSTPTGDQLRLGQFPDSDSARCVNRTVSLTTSTGEIRYEPIPEARSLVVSDSGVIVATRDVCPEGARWGDTTDVDAEVVVLASQPPDDRRMFHETEVARYATEDAAESISPDGRWLALRVGDSIESWHWELRDLASAGALVTEWSACASGGPIIAPPRFISEHSVVTIRNCSNQLSGDASGQLAVEELSLADDGTTLTPMLVNSTWLVDGFAINNYTSAIDMSARLIDDELWVMLSAPAGVEAPTRTLLVHESERYDVSNGSLQAFSPEELIGFWEAPAD